MLERVLAHFADFLDGIPNPDCPEAENVFEKLRSSLGITIVLLQNLDSSLDLYELLWEALYMLMTVSRFTGNVGDVCRGLAEYFKRKRRVPNVLLIPSGDE